MVVDDTNSMSVTSGRKASNKKMNSYKIGTLPEREFLIFVFDAIDEISRLQRSKIYVITTRHYKNGVVEDISSTLSQIPSHKSEAK